MMHVQCRAVPVAQKTPLGMLNKKENLNKDELVKNQNVVT